MVTCSAVVDGGRWREGPAEEELLQARSTSTSSFSSSRTLVYDGETGSLRFSKPNRSTAILSPKSSHSPVGSFKLEFYDHLAEVDSTNNTPPCKELHGEGFADSGESSPTCVIQNSALRSNSSSPTMSTISKPSSDSGRTPTETKLQGVATTRSPPEIDEEVVNSGEQSPRSELHMIGDVRERVRILEGINSTSGRSEPKGLLNTYSSMAKENAGWSMPQSQAKDATQNPPFKSIQCAVAEVQTVEVGMKKSKHGRVIPVARLADSSIMHCQKAPGIFSFNATYMSSPADSDDQDSDFSDQIHSDTTTTAAASTTPKTVVVQQQQQQHQQQQQQQQNQQQVDLCRRTYLAPLLKPTPSKWDDAEKWLPGSECHSARAKSRSGPLLAQLVAAQFGMSIPWKGPQLALPLQTDRLLSSPGVALGQRGEQSEVDSSGSETVDVKDVQTQSSATTATPGFVHFTADEKEQLDRLLDRYAVENVGAAELVPHRNSSSSPSRLNGSFLKLGFALEKPPVVEFSPPPEDYKSKNTLDLNLKPNYTKAATRDTKSTTTQEGDALHKDSTSNSARVATRDMGTAMTPTPSVEPSRTSTPLREKAQKADDAVDVAKESTAIAESALSEEEFQAKTRHDIVALGTQLGKASIAAAWAALEKDKDARELLAAGRRSSDTLDMENLRRDVFASRADAWQEAEKAKYVSRFEQEQVKIQTWEEHEKAKAEAEMRKIELKVERLKSQAHERLTRKLATMRRHAEELRLAAESRRGDSAAKVARKAEILKTNGKITNLLFLSFICT